MHTFVMMFLKLPGMSVVVKKALPGRRPHPSIHHTFSDEHHPPVIITRHERASNCQNRTRCWFPPHRNPSYCVENGGPIEPLSPVNCSRTRFVRFPLQSDGHHTPCLDIKIPKPAILVSTHIVFGPPLKTDQPTPPI